VDGGKKIGPVSGAMGDYRVVGIKHQVVIDGFLESSGLSATRYECDPRLWRLSGFRITASAWQIAKIRAAD
jgi:hypothetical protein